MIFPALHRVLVLTEVAGPVPMLLTARIFASRPLPWAILPGAVAAPGGVAGVANALLPRRIPCPICSFDSHSLVVWRTVSIKRQVAPRFVPKIAEVGPLSTP